jgi:hypothetical protein
MAAKDIDHLPISISPPAISHTHSLSRSHSTSQVSLPILTDPDPAMASRQHSSVHQPCFSHHPHTSVVNPHRHPSLKHLSHHPSPNLAHSPPSCSQPYTLKLNPSTTVTPQPYALKLELTHHQSPLSSNTMIAAIHTQAEAENRHQSPLSHNTMIAAIHTQAEAENHDQHHQPQSPKHPPQPQS